MILEMYELGKLLGDERITKKEHFNKVISIVVNENKSQYEKIMVSDYDENKHPYKEGSSRGSNVLPSAYVAGKGIETTFVNKIYNWCKNWREAKYTGFLDFDVMSAVILESHDPKNKEQDERLISELNSQYEKVKSFQKESKDLKESNTGIMLTVSLIRKGSDDPVPLSGFHGIKEVTDISMASHYGSPGTGKCYLCGIDNKTVYGEVLPSLGYKFATADKPGFAPGLNETVFWKKIPVCGDCAETLQNSLNFMDNYLTFPKDGKSRAYLRFSYKVIPRFVSLPNSELFNKIRMNFENSTNGADHYGLLSGEDRLIAVSEEAGIGLSFDFLFFTQTQSQFEIRHYTENALPSTFLLLHKAAKIVSDYGVFDEDTMKSIFGKGHLGRFVDTLKPKNGRMGEWYVKCLSDFFFDAIKDSKGNIREIANDDFFKILDSWFLNQPMPIDIIPFMMEKIREKMSKIHQHGTWDFQRAVVESYLLYQFINQAQHKDGVMNMSKTEIAGETPAGKSNALQETVDTVLLSVSDEWKKACISVGGLVSRLLWVQRKERGVKPGREPFWSELNHLMIDENRLRSIFKKSCAKFRDYETNGYPWEEEAARHFMEWERTSEEKEVPQDQISYYFTVGFVYGWSGAKPADKVQGGGQHV